MNSLKRLFSSILPSSWTEDPQNDDASQNGENIKYLKNSNRGHLGNNSKIDSQDEISSRKKRKIKRRG